MASSYYRLRGVRGISNGSLDIARPVNDAGLTDEFGRRTGPRRQDARQSVTFGHLPQGSHTRTLERPSQLNLHQGPNYGPPTSTEEAEWLERRGWDMVPDRTRLPDILERSSFWSRFGLGLPPRASQIIVPPTISEESFFSPNDSDGSSGVHQRAMENLASAAAAAESGSGSGPSSGSHSAGHQRARVQRQPPVPRPLSGLHPMHLETLYNDIRKWRAQLKKCNYDIAEKQQQLYDDISNGVSVRGWLLLGRGVRFLPGVKMIEGRSKDDVRWSELQHDGGVIGRVSFWIIVAVVSLLLAGARMFFLNIL
jgi:calcium permeable stress-gated cation channel